MKYSKLFNSIYDFAFSIGFRGGYEIYCNRYDYRFPRAVKTVTLSTKYKRYHYFVIFYDYVDEVCLDFYYHRVNHHFKPKVFRSHITKKELLNNNFEPCKNLEQLISVFKLYYLKYDFN